MFKRICIALVTALLSLSAHAIPVTWTFQNTTFDDGGTATGSFVYDADTNVMSDWSVFTMPGNGPYHLTPKSYTTTNAHLLFGPVIPGPSGTAWYATLESDVFGHPINNALLSNFRIGTTSALTNLGGTVGLDLNNWSGECYSCSRPRLFATGSLIARTQNAPEPSVLSLILGAMLGIVVLRRRIRR